MVFSETNRLEFLSDKDSHDRLGMIFHATALGEESLHVCDGCSFHQVRERRIKGLMTESRHLMNIISDELEFVLWGWVGRWILGFRPGAICHTNVLTERRFNISCEVDPPSPDGEEKEELTLSF
jgi:hypothetical protein